MPLNRHLDRSGRTTVLSRTFRPVIESIEQRLLLTVWTVTGTANADTIRVYQTGPDAYQAVINGGAPLMSGAGRTSIQVVGGEGSDTIIIESTSIPINVNGSEANDIVRIGFFSSGNHTLSNISSTITLDDISSFSGVGDNDVEIYDTASGSARTYTFDNNATDDSFVTWSGSTGKIRWKSEYKNQIIRVTNSGGTANVRKLASADNLQILGGSGNDTLNVNPVGGMAVAMAGSISFTGGSGNDTVNASDNGRTNINLQTISLRNDRITHSLAGNFIRLETGIESINLTGSPFADRIDLLSGPAGRTVSVDANAGADSISFTTVSRRLSDWQSPVSINARNAATVTLDDGLNPAARTFNIITDNVTSAGLPTITLSNLPILDIIAGSSDDVFSISSNPATRTVRMFGNSGADTFSLGAGINMNSIQGTINAYGEAGSDTIVFSDAFSSNSVTYTFTRDSGTQTGFSRSITNVSGFFQTIENLELAAGPGNDTVNANGSANGVALLLAGNSGNDTFNLGNGNIDVNLPLAATIIGGAGSDIVVYNDQTDADTGTYTFNVDGSDNNFRKSNMASDIQFRASGIESQILNANNSPNSVLVRNAVVPLTLNTSAGSDSITIEDSSIPVVINSGTGDDELLVNSDFASAGDTPALARLVADDHLFRLSVRRGGTLRLDPSVNLLVGSLAPANTGVFEMTGTINMDNRSSMAIRRTAATLSQINLALRAAYVGGVWNGIDPSGTTGAIHSLFSTGSAAADGIGFGVFADVLVPSIGSFTLEPNDIVIRHTLAGDANLDRTVDFNDLVALARNYNTSSKIWSNGNFDYDALDNVGFSDLVILARSYGQSLPAATLSSSNPSRTTQSDRFVDSVLN